MGCAGIAAAGSIDLRWDAIVHPQLIGYRIHIGPASGQYTTTLDLGPITATTLNGVPSCSEQHIAITGLFTDDRQSPIFSNEIAGWGRPMIDTVTPAAVEVGRSVTLTIQGDNFRPGAQLLFSDPAIRVDDLIQQGCQQLSVDLHIETSAQVGATDFVVSNPDQTAGVASGLLQLLPPQDLDADGFSLLDGDCDDNDPAVHPGRLESCNGIDDDCNGLVDDDGAGVDSDADLIPNACDNCVATPNASQLDLDGDSTGEACDSCPGLFDPLQADFDLDGSGDRCDLDDGRIELFFDANDLMHWQDESGFVSWNWYRGDLQIVRDGGAYTQAESVESTRKCGTGFRVQVDNQLSQVGRTFFYLISGTAGGVEAGQGTTSAGATRPLDDACGAFP